MKGGTEGGVFIFLAYNTHIVYNQALLRLVQNTQLHLFTMGCLPLCLHISTASWPELLQMAAPKGRMAVSHLYTACLNEQNIKN